jgi:hypothetical protein
VSPESLEVKIHGVIDHVEGVDLMPAQRKCAPELLERAVAMYRTAEPRPVIR